MKEEVENLVTLQGSCGDVHEILGVFSLLQSVYKSTSLACKLYHSRSNFEKVLLGRDVKYIWWVEHFVITNHAYDIQPIRQPEN